MQRKWDQIECVLVPLFGFLVNIFFIFLFSAAQQPRPTVTTEGVFFFFTRIGSRPYQNSGKYRRVFLFHQNWFATIPKFREIQEGLLFFTRIGSRPYQNLGKYRSVSFSLTCKGHDTVVSLSAGDDTRPAEKERSSCISLNFGMVANQFW